MHPVICILGVAEDFVDVTNFYYSNNAWINLAALNLYSPLNFNWNHPWPFLTHTNSSCIHMTTIDSLKYSLMSPCSPTWWPDPHLTWTWAWQYFVTIDNVFMWTSLNKGLYLTLVPASILCTSVEKQIPTLKHYS